MKPWAALLSEAAEILGAAGVNGPDRDARLLLRWVAGVDGVGLSLILDQVPDLEEASRFNDALKRRARREPLSHITGAREFWGRPFEVNRHVLDPRPETEVLIGEALARGPFERVLDLGTGSGAILITLLCEWLEAIGTGSDISVEARSVAARNATRHDVISRTEIVASDWFDSITGSFDLIVSNPPYIAADEMPKLAPEVREFEPHLALSPGGDGLSAYRRIAERARQHLDPGGIVLLEIGPTQREAVTDYIRRARLTVRGIIPDLDRRPRVVVAQA